MTAGSDSVPAVAGGLARHIPVLVRPAIELLDVRAGGLYVDATFGGGGLSRAILAAADCRVVGIDRDPLALARADDLRRQTGSRLELVEGRFSQLRSLVRQHDVCGIVFDLGVSSMQLDEAARGFSFRQEGPLDMRMGGAGPSAREVVAAATERELAAIIAALGEERHARGVARAIVAGRQRAPIETTRALADIVAGAVAPRSGLIHPATRTFQALRMFVNDELSELVEGLSAAESLLAPGGRLVIIAFHSLEDRIAKTFLAERSRRAAASRHLPQVPSAAPTFRLLTRRPVTPDESELASNPRARSAKLRAAERTGAAPALAPPWHLLPALPPLEAVVGRRQPRGRRR